jgi:hypothetical protein
MSFVVAVPEFVASAASDLASIGSGLTAAHAVAAGPTTGVVAAAGDKVSAAIASLFAGHGQACRSLSTQASAFSWRVCARLERREGRVFADRGGQRLAATDGREKACWG